MTEEAEKEADTISKPKQLTNCTFSLFTFNIQCYYEMPTELLNGNPPNFCCVIYRKRTKFASPASLSVK